MARAGRESLKEVNPKLPLRYVLTVTELTQEIKGLLEAEFSDRWVEGEISNLRIPPSGHLYFTLKDDLSQIRVVLFRTEARNLRFLPENGLHVLCRGRVGLYEKRGEYQLVLESMEPKGVGALQLAFLQLKERLEKEGLFDSSHKRPLPMVPQKIGIITSPTGAVIRDMINVISRRFENVSLLLYPVRVQGEGASLEIARAIDDLNRRMDLDVVIVGRGGGSLEDLWAFNEEEVARAIYRSKIPVISAVGHETDYTIADFVADLRAPTPSAAAELVVSDKREMKRNIDHLEGLLESRVRKVLHQYQSELSYLKKIILSPKKRIEDYFLRVDELAGRLSLSSSWFLGRKRENLDHLGERIYVQNPLQSMRGLQSDLLQFQRRLEQTWRHRLDLRRGKVAGILGKLESLSPLSILQRGYSITRKIPSLRILRDAADVREGEKVEVRLHRGSLLCGVEKIERP
jgi:exodeoxyribonuclease VII large subunit